MNQQRAFGWAELAVGVLFLICAFLAFTQPDMTVTAIILAFSITAVFRGITSLIKYFQFRSLTGFKRTMLLVIGVLDIIMGVIFLLNVGAGLLVMATIFAIWFILSSVVGLAQAEFARPLGTGYYIFSIIVNIVGIILGVILLLQPATALGAMAFLVAFYFALYGIALIILAFQSNKGTF